MADFSDFIEQLHNLGDRQLLEDFLMGITTDKERAELAQRLEIVKRLIAGEPQHKIASDLGVGIATVTRGSKELIQGRFKSLRQSPAMQPARPVKKTATILDDIVAAKKQYVAACQRQRPRARLERAVAELTPSKNPGFFETLKAEQPKLKLIAEVKQASPSAGVLRQPFVLADINQAYQAADNVAAISIITERDFFQGSEATLTYFAAHNLRHKPLLRKDFIIDSYQILETKLLGAQAYLLIATLFEAEELSELVDYGLNLGLEPLVEVHTAAELTMARHTAARCIGVNSRNLHDFSIDVTAHELLQQLPDSYVRVAESGIDTPQRLRAALSYADAALIGTPFMKAADIGVAIEQLVDNKVAS